MLKNKISYEVWFGCFCGVSCNIVSTCSFFPFAESFKDRKEGDNHKLLWALGLIYSPEVMELCHFKNLISEVSVKNKLWERKRLVILCVCV